jgi:hypothetical protein
MGSAAGLLSQGPVPGQIIDVKAARWIASPSWAAMKLSMWAISSGRLAKYALLSDRPARIKTSGGMNGSVANSQQAVACVTA